MKKIENITTDIERAYYHTWDAEFINCKFTGPIDGESAIKECKNIIVNNCLFALRYPFWHNTSLIINDTKLLDTCRAALWYVNDAQITNSELLGIKVVRECHNIRIKDSIIDSKECFWMSDDITLTNTKINSEYPLFRCDNVTLINTYLNGKYSFQYCKHVSILDSVLDTKDAFWHSENVTVKNSTINGEYLGWYSKNLHLINCTIKGTQPLCYCEGLILENCKMIDCDLSFEYSDVKATIISSIDSIKNPKSGYIICDDIKETILDEFFIDEGIKINNK